AFVTLKGYEEIEEAIMYIQDNIDQSISLVEIANHVAYSPYHFSRLFTKQAGISPLYYVYSLRLHTAKELLLKTCLILRNIVLEIGQQSLDTFTTRFTERAGQSPAQFRNSIVEADHQLEALTILSAWNLGHTEKHVNVVKGTVQAEVPFHGVIFIGLFQRSIPEGLPVYGTVLYSLGNYSFTNVKPGKYYLMTTAISWETKATDILLPHTTLRARSIDPIIIQNGTPLYQQN